MVSKKHGDKHTLEVSNCEHTKEQHKAALNLGANLGPQL